VGKTTHLESREGNRLSTTPRTPKRATGTSSSLINQIHPHRQINPLSDSSSRKHRCRSDTGLLEDYRSLDGSSSDDDFSSSICGVGLPGFISEFNAGSSRGGTRGKEGFAYGCTG
jgi:hypothetical protein